GYGIESLDEDLAAAPGCGCGNPRAGRPERGHQSRWTHLDVIAVRALPGDGGAGNGSAFHILERRMELYRLVQEEVGRRTGRDHDFDDAVVVGTRDVAATRYD